MGKVRAIENASVDGVAPAGSVWSSVSDMAKWSALLLNSGKVGDRVLLKPETVEELFKPQTLVTTDAFLSDGAAHYARSGRPTAWAGFSRTIAAVPSTFTPAASTAWWRSTGCSGTRSSAYSCSANRDHAELRHAIMLNVFDRFIGGASARLERRAA